MFGYRNFQLINKQTKNCELFYLLFEKHIGNEYMASYCSFFSAFMLTRPLQRLEHPSEPILLADRLIDKRKEKERLENTIM